MKFSLRERDGFFIIYIYNEKQPLGGEGGEGPPIL